MQKKAFILIIVVFLIVFYVGLNTEVSLGDESYHYRLAKCIYHVGNRPVFDNVYQAVPKLGFNFTNAPLWHIGLANVWKLFGKLSFTVAQLYHSLFFLTLMISFYCFSKKLYGEKIGFLSLLLLISCPGIIALSLVFYLEIPMITFLILSFLCISVEYYLFAGVFAGLMILTKISGLLFLPCFAIVIILSSVGFKKKLINFLKFTSLVIIVNLPDIIFRIKNFHYLYYTPPQLMATTKELSNNIPYFYLPNSMSQNPLFLFKYTGIILPVLLVLYFIFKKYDKLDRPIWFSVITYLFFCCFLFRNNLDVRYFIPIFPLLILLSAKALSVFRKKSIVISLYVLVFMQFFAVLGVTYYKRKIPAGIKEGFAFIAKNIDEKAVFMYPEENMIDHTGHPIAWGRIFSLPTLFWQADSKSTLEILKEYEIDYIAIKKSRIYDDSNIHHTGGYPASFVDKLPKLTFLKLLFENKELSIWQVNREGVEL